MLHLQSSSHRCVTNDMIVLMLSFGHGLRTADPAHRRQPGGRLLRRTQGRLPVSEPGPQRQLEGHRLPGDTARSPVLRSDQIRGREVEHCRCCAISRNIAPKLHYSKRQCTQLLLPFTIPHRTGWRRPTTQARVRQTSKRSASHPSATPWPGWAAA